MTDAQHDLSAEIRQLEEKFTVSTETLKKVTAHFAEELAKGRLLQCL